jgi:hypothetical protein
MLMRLTLGRGAPGDVRPWAAVPVMGSSVGHRAKGTRMPVATPATVTTTTASFVNIQHQQPNLNHPAFAATHHWEEPG